MIRKYQILRYGGVIFTTTLIRVNIKKNINRYCKLLLLVSKSDICFQILSGRVGKVPKRRDEYYTGIQRAIHEFKLEYYRRTGNEWGAQQIRKSNKYSPFHKETPTIEIACNDDLKDLFTIIATSIHKESSLVTPLGIPSMEQYIEACSILTQLKSVLKCKRASLRRRSVDPEIFIRDQSELLSQRFFELIPTHQPLRISSMETYIKYRSVLKSIKSYINPSVIPEKLLFSNLGVSLVNIPKNSTWDLIKEYVDNSQTLDHDFRVKKIIKCQNDSQKAKYAPQRLLFHGTRARNISSILKNGLQLSDRDNLSMGRAIYLTDSITKSMSYTDKKGYIFLCSIPNGTTIDIVTSKADIGAKSPICMARGRTGTTIEKTVKIDNVETIVPGNKARNLDNGSDFRYNEYAVYRQELCRIEYILQIER